MRLIKLAMLALFGYAMYEFFRGLLQDTQLGARVNDAFGQLSAGLQQQGGQGGQGGGQQRSFGGSTAQGAGMNMTGPGEGMEESSLERDGGSVSHKVGRGVIS